MKTFSRLHSGFSSRFGAAEKGQRWAREGWRSESRKAKILLALYTTQVKKYGAHLPPLFRFFWPPLTTFSHSVPSNSLSASFVFKIIRRFPPCFTFQRFFYWFLSFTQSCFTFFSTLAPFSRHFPTAFLQRGSAPLHQMRCNFVTCVKRRPCLPSRFGVFTALPNVLTSYSS